MKSYGFTLLELLLVIAIIAIIAATIFVSLDPLTRFQSARDARRWVDLRSIADAITLEQIDRGGSYQVSLNNLTNNQVYMIVNGSMSSGCDDNNLNCQVAVTNDSSCVDLSYLVTSGYLAEIPVSPNLEIDWDLGASDGQEGTGYTLEKRGNGIVVLRACEAEQSDQIYIAR